MTQVVQAKCPHCKNNLRIPAPWVERALRCKFCKHVFQSNPSSPQVLAVGTARDPFSFEEVREEETPGARRPRRRGRGPVVLLTLFALLSLGAIGATAFVVLRNRPGSEPRAETPRDETQVSSDSGSGETKTPKTNPKTNPGKPNTGKPTIGNTAFPRRALLISVNNYLMFNSVHYGRDRPKDKSFPGSSSGALREQFSVLPMNFPKDQVYELSDAAEKPFATQKAVIETTIRDFLEGSRPQDRVVLLFSGHGIDIEKDSYLIPIEGSKDNVDSLIPLRWVYDQLAKCKARQKVFIVDVFRYSPARGFELPGAGEGERGEMGEVFDQNLLNAPPGVQVWASCVKGQAAIELESGSTFLQALLRSMQERSITAGIGTPGDSIPVEDLVVKVNKKMKEMLAPEKQEQLSRLTGKEADGGAPYDVSQPAAPALAFKPPPAPPGGSAGYNQIDGILAEIRELPPVRETRAGEQNLLRAANLPPFPIKAVEPFKAEDGKTLTALLAEFTKDKTRLDTYAKDFPIRAAVVESVMALQVSNKIQMRETLNGPIDPKRKTAFLDEQRGPGQTIFELEQVLGRMKTLADEREKEKSKRWQANFDFTMARLESRLVYLFEYSYILAQIRSDALPSLEPGQSGWRVGARKKAQVTEPKIKALAKEITRTWKRIEEEYPQTPWAILAKRENLLALGLEWRAKSD